MAKRNLERELAEALGDCIERLQRQPDVAIDECLEKFPALADDLRPLLHIALELKGSARSPERSLRSSSDSVTANVSKKMAAARRQA